MSEEEIIKEIENYENWKVVYNPGGLYQFIPLPKDYKQAIQGLLDLYQKEKEKNKNIDEFCRKELAFERRLKRENREPDEFNQGRFYVSENIRKIIEEE